MPMSHDVVKKIMKVLVLVFQVLCFGLGLPLSEHDTINDCVKVYVEWLMVLTGPHQPKTCVPKPVARDPNPYAQVILHHLLNLFKPRPESGEINSLIG